MLTSSITYPQHKRIITTPNDTQNIFSRNEAFTIRTAREAHLEFVKSCQRINELYGLQILVSIGVSFIVITLYIYNSYVLINDSTIPTYTVYKAVAVSFIWTLYNSTKILVFSWACSKTVENAIKTGDVINEFYDEPLICNETRHEIKCFNLQLIRVPIQFTAYGFIDLNLTLIQAMIASITTYIMILIQLGKTPTA